MASDWQKLTLGDFVTLQRGHDLTASERREGTVPVMGAAGQNGFHDTAIAKGPGIVVGRSGGSFGQVHYSVTDFWPHNTGLYVTDYKGNDQRFAFYLLKLLDFNSYNSGSAQPSLNRNFIYPIPISVPQPIEQAAIASVLTALDTKIELNQQINAELEGMAKLLYDYWFVQFDFPISSAQATAMGKPHLEGKPYRSSGGKMVFDPSLKREIPAGWEASSVGETFNTHLGGTPLRKEPSYWSPDEVAWLSSGEKEHLFVCAPDECISRRGLSNSPATLLPKGSVILSIVRHIRASILGIEAATNQSVVGIKETDTIKHCFIYPFIMGEIPRFMILRTGAQQPHINKGTVDETPLVIPAAATLKAYTAIAGPLFEQIRNHQQQNQELTALRDWLLPMLMNGQVTVGCSESASSRQKGEPT